MMITSLSHCREAADVHIIVHMNTHRNLRSALQRATDLDHPEGQGNQQRQGKAELDRAGAAAVATETAHTLDQIEFGHDGHRLSSMIVWTEPSSSPALISSM